MLLCLLLVACEANSFQRVAEENFSWSLMLVDAPSDAMAEGACVACVTCWKPWDDHVPGKLTHHVPVEFTRRSEGTVDWSKAVGCSKAMDCSKEYMQDECLKVFLSCGAA